MFSVIFPGQGSQLVGMGKDFFDRFDLVKKLFKEADDALEINLSKIIFEGPKDNLDLTINTQPAIFLISYSIFKIVTEEFNIDLKKILNLILHLNYARDYFVRIVVQILCSLMGVSQINITFQLAP